MPTAKGIMTAYEFISGMKMTPAETVTLVNAALKNSMTDHVLSVGFFMINIKPRHDAELMISLLRDAGFTVGRTKGGDQRESYDYLRVEVPKLP